MLQQEGALAVRVQTGVREQERGDDGKLCNARPWYVCGCRQPKKEKDLESTSRARLMVWMNLKPWIVGEEGELDEHKWELTGDRVFQDGPTQGVASRRSGGRQL